MLWPTAGMYNPTFVFPDVEKQFTVEKALFGIIVNVSVPEVHKHKTNFSQNNPFTVCSSILYLQ